MKKHERPVVVYLFPHESSFIRTDKTILEKKYTVIPCLVGGQRRKVFYMFSLVRLFFFLLIRGACAKAFICWFGDYHSFIMVLAARILRKKSIILIGGQESICYKEFGKGVFCNKQRGRLLSWSFRHATLIIANHKSLLFHENFYYDPEGKKDGILHYIPGLKTRVEVVHNGINADRFPSIPVEKKNPKMVLSVGHSEKMPDIILKGFDLLTGIARRNPRVEFVLVGIGSGIIDETIAKYGCTEIPNLTLVPFNLTNPIVDYFHKAKVYVQASITEGMPNTLSEAMLSNCIPVGSNVNGIPDAIGPAGIIVKKRDMTELENAILLALKMETTNAPREYTLKNFTSEIREKKLLEIIGSVI